MSTPAAAPFQPPPFGSYGAPAAQPGISIDSLINEIEQLVVAARAELGRSPYDTSIQTELKALLDLQTVLKTRGAMLSQEQLVPVKTQVANLAVKYRASNAHQTVTPTPPIHGTPFHAPMQHPPQQIAPVAPAPPASAPPGSVSLDALLGKGALAALLSRRSATPQAPTPQPQAQPQPQPTNAAALRSPTPQRAETQKPATPDPMALLGALRGVGLIPPTPQSGGTPVSNPSGPPAQAAANTAPAMTPNPAAGGISLPPNLASILASARSLAASSTPPPVVITSGDISLTTASLKQYATTPLRVLCLFDRALYESDMSDADSLPDSAHILFPPCTRHLAHRALNVGDASKRTRREGKRRQPTWTGTSGCTRGS